MEKIIFLFVVRMKVSELFCVGVKWLKKVIRNSSAVGIGKWKGSFEPTNTIVIKDSECYLNDVFYYTVFLYCYFFNEAVVVISVSFGKSV